MTLAGGVYTVRLDGQQTTTYVNADGYRRKPVQADSDDGLIGVQSYSGRVASRNIRIKAL